jgi:hypothetical protein
VVVCPSSLIGCADSLLNDKGELVGIALGFYVSEMDGVIPVEPWLDISEIRAFVKEKDIQLSTADAPEVVPRPREASSRARP